MYRSEHDTRLVEALRDTAVASLPDFWEEYELLIEADGVVISVFFMGALALYAAKLLQSEEVSDRDKTSRLNVIAEIVERAATPKTNFLDNIIITGFFESIASDHASDRGTRQALKRILGPQTLALLSEITNPNRKYPVRDPFV